MVSVEDYIAITQVLNLYGHVVDQREWDRMGEIFAQDAVFDGSSMGGARMEGLDYMVQCFRDPSASHPLAHHSSNIVITQEANGMARVISKGFGPRTVADDSRAVTYRDVLTKMPEGWRIKERVVSLMLERPND